MKGWIVKEDNTYKLFYEIDGKGKPYKLGNVWASMYANMKEISYSPYNTMDPDTVYPVTLQLTTKNSTYVGAWLVEDANKRKKVVFDIDKPDCKPYKLLSVWSTSYSNMTYVDDTNIAVSFDDEEPKYIWLTIHKDLEELNRQRSSRQNHIDELHKDLEEQHKNIVEQHKQSSSKQSQQPAQKSNQKSQVSARQQKKNVSELIKDAISTVADARRHLDVCTATDNIELKQFDNDYESKTFDDGWDGTLPQHRGLPYNARIVTNDDDYYYGCITKSLNEWTIH